MPQMRLEFPGQARDRGHVDGAGEHGDVVEGDVDGAVEGDLAEVGVDALGAQAVVEGRDDRHGAGAELVIGLAGRDGFAHVGLGGAGQHGHAAGGLVADDLVDPPAFLGREAGELAGRAVGVQPMHALGDEPVDVAPQFRLVDLALGVQRHDVRGVDAGDGGPWPARRLPRVFGHHGPPFREFHRTGLRLKPASEGALAYCIQLVYNISMVSASASSVPHGMLRKNLVGQALVAIIRGDLPGGQWLVEQDMAERFGVSRTPIRETINQLAGFGVVRLYPNRGAQVQPFGPEQLRDIYLVRQILESEAARLGLRAHRPRRAGVAPAGSPRRWPPPRTIPRTGPGNRWRPTAACTT